MVIALLGEVAAVFGDVVPFEVFITFGVPFGVPTCVPLADPGVYMGVALMGLLGDAAIISSGS